MGGNTNGTQTTGQMQSLLAMTFVDTSHSLLVEKPAGRVLVRNDSLVTDFWGYVGGNANPLQINFFHIGFSTVCDICATPAPPRSIPPLLDADPCGAEFRRLKGRGSGHEFTQAPAPAGSGKHRVLDRRRRRQAQHRPLRGLRKIHPSPRLLCRHCQSENVAPQAVPGTGTIDSFTINHQPWAKGLEVPYVIARVKLDGAPGSI